MTKKYFLGSASASAYAGASALSNADAFAGTFGETGSFSGTHDGHKGIRSYGFPQGTDANRDTKSYNTPSAHGGAGRHHGIKGGDHDYNKNGDGCSKCKWENDDYWERDEPEEEEDEVNEDECDDGDDGQYRPGKHDHYGSGGANKGPKRRLQPPGVHKTGPTGVYTDDGIQAGGGVNPSSFSPNIPNTGYSKPTNNFGITSKPSFGWNNPSIASKPEYGGVTANAFATPSSSWPNWQGGTTPSGFGTSPKPAWSDKHDGVPAGSYRTTPKPGTSWNTAPTGSNAPTGRFPSTPGAPQNTRYGNIPVENLDKDKILDLVYHSQDFLLLHLENLAGTRAMIAHLLEVSRRNLGQVGILASQLVDFHLHRNLRLGILDMMMEISEQRRDLLIHQDKVRILGPVNPD